jgi:hypothetical protein
VTHLVNQQPARIGIDDYELIRKSVAAGVGFSDLGLDFFCIRLYMPHLNS